MTQEREGQKAGEKVRCGVGLGGGGKKKQAKNIFLAQLAVFAVLLFSISIAQ